MRQAIPDPPQGRIEFDFCQTPRRISVREENGQYILYAKVVGGNETVLARSTGWETIYDAGRCIAETERQWATGRYVAGKFIRAISGKR